MEREQKGGRKGMGERNSTSFLLPFLLSSHFSRGPNVKNSFARPEFRLLRTERLATKAIVKQTKIACSSPPKTVKS